MHEYDVTLKLLLQKSADSVLSQTFGNLHVSRWLNVELPNRQTLRADLVGETADGGLVHIELQSSNNSEMALRMAEYALRIYRHFGKLPKQLVLYVGEQAVRMPVLLRGPDDNHPDVSFQYTLVDFRDLDGTALLASPSIEDNLLAVLAKLRDQRSAVKEILTRIADFDEPERLDLLTKFLILSGLRKLADVARREAEKMPILTSILDHELFGPAILQGRKEGLEEGRKEGLAAGRVNILQRQLEKRFGTLPAWVPVRLAGLSTTELDEVAIRLLDAPNLDALFSR